MFTSVTKNSTVGGTTYLHIVFHSVHTSVTSCRRKSGTRLVGDVSVEASARAALLTPVPGGVGPVTVAMLLRNTLDAALIAPDAAVQARNHTDKL